MQLNATKVAFNNTVKSNTLVIFRSRVEQNKPVAHPEAIPYSSYESHDAQLPQDTAF
jgi:hypothetical protein